MPKATWNGVLIAESNEVELVEGNVYFPPDAVVKQHLRESDTRTECAWKGTAHYYHVELEGKVNRDAAWYYPDPKPAAENIKDHVAFWKGVDVEQ